MPSADRPATRLATRLAFLVAGFSIACWAPLVPFAKHRLGVDDGVLGLLLLCLGVGSIAAMAATGAFGSRIGHRAIIRACGLGVALLLPLLVIADRPATLGAALFAFGAALGGLDVAMNVHAVEVERAADRPMMSGFHGHFSLGEVLGAASVTGLLSLGLSPIAATLIAAVPMLGAVALAAPRLLVLTATAGPVLVRPRGVVVVLALLTAVAFLAEGAILDWGALLVTGAGLLDEARGGLGYMVFSLAMTAGRLGGDALTSRIGDRAMLRCGSLATIVGFAVLVAAAAAWVALAGFLLVGLGASNIVPVLFRRAGTQTAMPVGLAVAAISTTGYAGILAGPAAIGFVAQSLGLPAAFLGLAGLLGLVTLFAGRVSAEADAPPRSARPARSVSPARPPSRARGA